MSVPDLSTFTETMVRMAQSYPDEAQYLAERARIDRADGQRLSVCFTGVTL